MTTPTSPRKPAATPPPSPADPRPQAPVFFLSFSVLISSVLAVLLLAACASQDVSTADTPSSSTAEQTAAAPTLPATPMESYGISPTPTAPPPEAAPGTDDEFPTADETMVVVGSGAASLVGQQMVSAIAFDADSLEVAEGGPRRRPSKLPQRSSPIFSKKEEPALLSFAQVQPGPVDWNTEQYAPIEEQGFLRPGDNPLSTFSIDVDTASYANVRRFLNEETRPPAGAVRIEELVNYFHSPRRVEPGEQPFAVDMEIFEAPWREEHRLVRIAVEGRDIPQRAVPARNLVFLLDVSGSMQGADRLELVKYGLTRLTETLRPIDRVSIVVYAGASGVVLPPTAGNEEETIVSALERLSAGGSTAGAEGIQLAYRMARKNFDPEGINRVILATDGDFNVGVSSRSELVKLIEKERESGVFLTVLGVGRGNLNDSGMEQLADHGNGNYAYIDRRSEARKVLVEQANATLVTIAKDVKIQVEFNPERVQAYRLIGYENRRLADQDFNDDTKDAGEIGAGHHVTALYEVVPVGAKGGVAGATVDPLKYQAPKRLTDEAGTGEWLTVKLRYKAPDEDESKLVSAVLAGQPGKLQSASENARFSTAVALFGMLLRDSEFAGAGSYRLVEKLAEDSLGEDTSGQRKEFLELVSRARKL